MEKYKVISLFSGCGGLDLGLVGGFSYLGRYYDKNPFEIILANDINEKAVLTQKHNFKNIKVVCDDVVPQVDVFVKGEPLSIKTISTKTSRLRGGIKLVWTVDAKKAMEFKNNYMPKCDFLLVQITWGGIGKLCLFSLESQQKVLNCIGRDRYIKLPKEGTNPRGAEISSEAIDLLLECEDTRVIEIEFIRGEIDYREVYTKWLDAWTDGY